MKGIWRFVFGKPKQKKESKKERRRYAVFQIVNDIRHTFALLSDSS